MPRAKPKAEKHCENCTCDPERLEAEAHWNDAIDWLLNSRHTGDPDIQKAFWGIVDRKHTRDEADKL